MDGGSNPEESRTIAEVAGWKQAAKGFANREPFLRVEGCRRELAAMGFGSPEMCSWRECSGLMAAGSPIPSSSGVRKKHGYELNQNLFSNASLPVDWLGRFRFPPAAKAPALWEPATACLGTGWLEEPGWEPPLWQAR